MLHFMWVTVCAGRCQSSYVRFHVCNMNMYTTLHVCAGRCQSSTERRTSSSLRRANISPLRVWRALSPRASASCRISICVRDRVSAVLRCTCTSMYVCACAHTRIYSCAHSHSDTCTHTHTHTHTSQVRDAVLGVRQLTRKLTGRRRGSGQGRRPRPLQKEKYRSSRPDYRVPR